jgi:hypothetical protein
MRGRAVEAYRKRPCSARNCRHCRLKAMAEAPQKRGRSERDVSAGATPSASRLGTHSLVDLDRIPGARRAKRFGFVEPSHPTLRNNAPAGDQWVHEIKHDGYRVQIHLRDGTATVFTRRGYDAAQQIEAGRKPRPATRTRRRAAPSSLDARHHLAHEGRRLGVILRLMFIRKRPLRVDARGNRIQRRAFRRRCSPRNPRSKRFEPVSRPASSPELAPPWEGATEEYFGASRDSIRQQCQRAFLTCAARRELWATLTLGPPDMPQLGKARCPARSRYFAPHSAQGAHAVSWSSAHWTGLHIAHRGDEHGRPPLTAWERFTPAQPEKLCA